MWSWSQPPSLLNFMSFLFLPALIPHPVILIVFTIGLGKKDDSLKGFTVRWKRKSKEFFSNTNLSVYMDQLKLRSYNRVCPWM